MLVSLLVGFLFGYAGSMPVAGPISILVLHLAMEGKPRLALHVAIGGALAESGYVLLAFWGLSTALARYPSILPASRIVGALLLLILGLLMLLSQPRERRVEPEVRPRKGAKRSLLAGFLITAVNPTLLVTWTAALATLHATGLVLLGERAAIPFAAAACLGIVAWFCTLLWITLRFRRVWSAELVERVKRAMGVLLLGLGGWMALRAVVLR